MLFALVSETGSPYLVHTYLWYISAGGAYSYAGGWTRYRLQPEGIHHYQLLRSCAGDVRLIVNRYRALPSRCLTRPTMQQHLTLEIISKWDETFWRPCSCLIAIWADPFGYRSVTSATILLKCEQFLHLAPSTRRTVPHARLQLHGHWPCLYRVPGRIPTVRVPDIV